VPLASFLAVLVAAFLAAGPEGRSTLPAPAAPAFDDAWLDAALGALPAGAVPARPQGPLRAPSAGQAWLRRALAFSLDALPSALPLRRTIPARPPLEGTLDAALVQAKAETVLAMFQGYAGPDRWQAVLDAHRAAQGGQGADADVLLDALGSAAGAEVADSLRGFLVRPGVPVLRAEVRCGAAGPRVVLRLGGRGRGGEPPPALPVCLRAGGARAEVRICTLATAPQAEVALPFCPAWAWPNAGGVGYYLTALQPGEAIRLLPRLTPEERLALAADAAVLARQGEAPLAEALALVAPLARDPDPRLPVAALLLASLVEPAWLPAAEQAGWRAFLRRSFGPAARSLGWLPRPGDGETERAARAVLVPLLAGDGAEAVLAGEALALARRWLTERRQVPDEVGWLALEAAAHHGDRDLLSRVLGAAAQAPDAGERGRLWAAAGRFTEPEVARAALVLAEGAGPADEAALLASGLQGRETRDGAWGALQARWEFLAPRLPPEALAVLVEAAGRAACEPRRRAEVAAFLGWRATALEGTARALLVAFDQADACLAGRARRAAAAPRFLSGR
jgi:hypothetical protein